MKTSAGGKRAAQRRGADLQLPDARRDLWQAYSRFRERFDPETLPIDLDEVFADLRDPSPGRDCGDPFS